MMNYKNAMVLVAIMVVVGAQAESISHGGTTINMDFVDIGYIGNSPDSPSGYGAVDYNYRIGKYEVMASQWAAVITADSNVGNAGSWSGAQPTASSSWYEAARFCNWLTTGDAYTGIYQFDGSGVLTGYDRTYRNGNGVAYVLPSEDEWYKAAYYTGSDYSLYANGTDTAPGLETDANYGGTGGTYAGPWAVGTGTEEQNKTFDMMGNVWEWTEGADDGVLDDDIAFWGGAYNSTSLSKLQSGDPSFDAPDTVHPAVGFRVAAIPEPGTISLMGLSTISLFATRRIRRRKLAGKSLLPIRAEHSCDMFGTMESVEEDADYLVELRQSVKAQMSVVLGAVLARCHEVDKVFWNRMVVLNERRVARKIAFRQALKKKVLNGFDAFLELIMK
jgi:formylglycine-generating enzyme required for sulfatase activity